MARTIVWRTFWIAVSIATPWVESGRAQQAPTNQGGDFRSTIGKVQSKDGTSIAFERIGDGPTLILVAGALSNRTGGARLANLLAPHFTVLTYDRRGRGDSGDQQPYAVQREVEDLEALIDHEGDTAFVFGVSSGAVLALESAARLGPKVTKAALFEPPFVVDDSRAPVPNGFGEHVAELVAKGQRGEAVEYFMTVAVGVPAEQMAPMMQSPMWAGLEKLAHTLAYDGAILGDTLAGRPLPSDRWKGATMPVLVLDGGKSDDWLRNASHALAKLLPNAKRQTLDGLDHSATFMAPQAFVPVLTEFFLEKEP